MLDIGWSEMAVIVVVALLVVGPKDLPKVLRAVRYWIGKARSLAREFQDGVDDLVREAELKELRIEVEDATRDQLSGEFDDLVDPTGNLIGEPADDVRAPGQKPTAAGETADAKRGEREPDKGAPAAEQAGGQPAPPKPDGDERPGTETVAGSEQAPTPDGAEPRPGRQASQSKPAEPEPPERGAASASGR